MNDEPFFLKSVLDIELPPTVEDCHRLIHDLCHMFFKRIEKLEEDIKKLTRENNELKERLNNNFNNSSVPPSKDHKKKKPSKTPSTQKSGGQIGHKGHFRSLLDSQEVDSIVNCHLPSYCVCGGRIKMKENFQRRQVYELPKIKLRVTEYRLAKGRCTRCCENHIANLPEGITWGITGSRLTRLMSHLVSNYQLSRREVKAFLKEQYNFPISLGTLFNKQKIVNAALAVLTAKLLGAVKQSTSVNIDETGHHHHAKRQWVWCVVSPMIAYFSIVNSRGKKILKSLMGDYEHVVISDRYAA